MNIQSNFPPPNKLVTKYLWLKRSAIFTLTMVFLFTLASNAQITTFSLPGLPTAEPGNTITNPDNGITGDKFRYSNVATISGNSVDAIYEIVQISNATITNFDGTVFSGVNVGGDGRFQPFINIITSGGFIEWKVEIVETGTTIPVTLSNFRFDGIDVDGNENVAVKVTNAFTLEAGQVRDPNSTALLATGTAFNTPITVNGDGFHVFQGPAVGIQGIEEFRTDVAFRVNFANVSSFTFRTGANTTGNRLFSISFLDELNFTIEDETIVNTPPTFTSFNTSTETVLEDTQIEISLTDLQGSGNEADLDETSLPTFIITSVLSGELLIGASAGSATAFAVGTNDLINNTNNIYWTPAADENGNINAFSALVQDSEGVSSGTSSDAVTAQVTVTPVNDEPSFTVGMDQLASGTSPITINNFATALSAGPTNESGQTLNFNVSNNNGTIFTVPPSVDANGNLTFTPSSIGGTATVTLSIMDNGGTLNSGDDESDDQTFTITVSGFTVTESGGNTETSETGSTDSFDVVLTNQPTDNVEITITGLDSSEGALDVTTLTFTNTDWDIPQTVTVTGQNDALVDGDIAYNLNVSIVDANSDDSFDTLPDQQVTVTNTDDDSEVTIAVSPGTSVEGGADLVYTFTRTGFLDEVLTVNFNVSGTATLTTDFTQSGAASFSASAGTISIPSGDASASINISSIGDNLIEGNENVQFTITSGDYVIGTSGSANGVIDDADDGAGNQINIITTQNGAEGGNDIVYTVSLSDGTNTLTNVYGSPITVDLGLFGSGTAVAADVSTSPLPTTVSIANNSANQTVTLEVADDNLIEGAETAVVVITNPSLGVIGTGTASANITDEDQGANIEVNIATIQNGAEGGNDIVYTVNLSDGTNTLTNVTGSPITVDLGLFRSGTSVTADVSTSPLPTTVSIANNTASQTVTLEVADDNLIEGAETAVAVITNPSIGVIGTGAASANITDEDTIPIALDDTAITDEDTPIAIDVLSNDSDIDGDLLTIISTGVGGNGLSTTEGGSLSINNNGTASDPTDDFIDYLPNLNFNGIDSFDYRIEDEDGQILTASVNITVNSINDAPIAIDDLNNEVDEDNPLTINLIANNDEDLDDGLNLNSIVLIDPNDPSNVGNINIPLLIDGVGTYEVDANGNVTYSPASDYFGDASINYTIADASGVVSNVALIEINVNPTNDFPIALGESLVTDEDIPVSGNLNDNISDIDGDNLTLSLVAASLPDPASEGTVTLNEDGTYTFTPVAGFNGEVVFSYQVCDDGVPERCAVAVVTITVNPVNDPPIAVNDESGTMPNTPVTIFVLANDSDPEGEELIISEITSNPSNGTVQINLDGTVTYIPNNGFTGVDSFEYEICDGNKSSEVTACSMATVTVNVTNDALPPIAINDEFSGDEDLTVIGNLLVNDSDGNGDQLFINVNPITTPANGNLTINLDGTFEYIPNGDFNGVDTFTYEICDRAADPRLCDQATVTININPINDGPAASNESLITLEETPVSGDLIDNVIDIDNIREDLTFSLVLGTAPTAEEGLLVLNADGTYTFTPAEDFVGEVTFTYEVCDGGIPEQCARAEVTITVNPVNDGPIAINDVSGTVPNTPVTISVLSNDSDPEGDDLVLSRIITDPANGSVVLNSDGTISYTPNTGFLGVDSFEYEVCDGDASLVTTQCSTAEVTINVTNDPLPPVAVNDEFQEQEDVAVVGNLLANDSDGNGDQLFINQMPITAPTNGVLTINSDGTFEYLPNEGFNGEDQFVYEICDGELNPRLCDQAIVNLLIDPVNDSPIANPEEQTTPEEIAVSGELRDNVTDEDANLSGTNLTFSLVTSTEPDAASEGVLVFSSNGDYTFTPAKDYVGTITFDYEVCDSGSPVRCAIETVTIIVTPVNDPPTAEGETQVIDEDTQAMGTLTDNVFDIDGDDLLFSLISLPDPTTEGTVILNADGSYTFDPVADFFGTVTFTYQVCDDQSPEECAQAIITIIVNDVVDDSDGDGILDTDEDLNGDGDLDNDDSDGDGTPDYLDEDDDNDGIDTKDENYNSGDSTDDDSDGDGTPDYLDVDDDNDGINTEDENYNGGDSRDDDSDGDGTPDYLDVDDDNDGINTEDENYNGGDSRDDDSDGDGIPDYLDVDDDNDGVNTEDENYNGGDSRDDDSDSDNIPDYLDIDDDGDGITTEAEDINNDGDPTNDDTDGDGTPDYLDIDDDGDGIVTAEEAGDAEQDCDGDGIPNRLDPDRFNCGQDIPATLFISPFNVDGKNDFFAIATDESNPESNDGLNEFEDLRVVIFNRWGNVVWETQNYDNTLSSNRFEGKNLNGNELPAGSYYFVVDLKPIQGGNERVIRGFVEIR